MITSITACYILATKPQISSMNGAIVSDDHWMRELMRPENRSIIAILQTCGPAHGNHARSTYFVGGVRRGLGQSETLPMPVARNRFRCHPDVIRSVRLPDSRDSSRSYY